MQQAMLYSFLLIMPFALLSGLTTPISSMPLVLQYFTLINPLRYAIDIAQRVYLEGAGLDLLLPDLWPLGADRGADAVGGLMDVPPPHAMMLDAPRPAAPLRRSAGACAGGAAGRLRGRTEIRAAHAAGARALVGAGELAAARCAGIAARLVGHIAPAGSAVVARLAAARA